jgi:putative ABC transport system permease protein
MRSMSSDLQGTTDESYTGAAARVKEPPFQQFRDLPGVEAAARVYTAYKAMAEVNGTVQENIQIMGIDPEEFGRVVNFRDGLLPHHINDYLNLIADAPKGFLVSAAIRDKLKAKVGDPIKLTFDSRGAFYNVEGVIYGFIDYWPSFNPNIKSLVADPTNPDAPKQNFTSRAGPPGLVVGNLSYIQQSSTMDVYQVWLKKKQGASEEQIYKELDDGRINLSWLNSVEQLMIKKKNDPLLQGINGILTLDFIIMMLICMIGFLIFWILSIKNRVLQFGIFRAMGLPMKSILGMIACEQFFISGIAVVAGILIGGGASDLFIPMLQLIYSAAEQVPPFKVIAVAGDYYKIYMIVGAMLVTGLAVLRTIIKGINVNQAIKLGEE